MKALHYYTYLWVLVLEAFNRVLLVLAVSPVSHTYNLVLIKYVTKYNIIRLSLNITLLSVIQLII